MRRVEEVPSDKRPRSYFQDTSGQNSSQWHEAESRRPISFMPSAELYVNPYYSEDTRFPEPHISQLPPSANPYTYQQYAPNVQNSTSSYLQMPQLPIHPDHQRYSEENANFHGMPVPNFVDSGEYISSTNFQRMPQIGSYNQGNVFPQIDINENRPYHTIPGVQNPYTKSYQPTQVDNHVQSSNEAHSYPWPETLEQRRDFDLPNMPNSYFNGTEGMPSLETMHYNHHAFQDNDHEMRNRPELCSHATSPSDFGILTPLSPNGHSSSVHFPIYPGSDESYSLGIEKPSSTLGPVQLNADARNDNILVPESETINQISEEPTKPAFTSQKEPTDITISNIPALPKVNLDNTDSPHILPNQLDLQTSIPDDTQSQTLLNHIPETPVDSMVPMLESLKINTSLTSYSQDDHNQSPEENSHRDINVTSPGCNDSFALQESLCNEESPKDIHDPKIDSENGQSLQCNDQECVQDDEAYEGEFTDSDSDGEPDGSALPLLFDASDCLLNSEFIAANELYTLYPPKFTNKSKISLFNQFSSKVGKLDDCIVQITRWQTSETYPDHTLYQEESYSLKIRLEENYFTYPVDPKGCTWHVNFSDGELFGNYGASELATDELQVLEHPILGSVRELLLHRSKTYPTLAPKTLEVNSANEVVAYKSTPILIQDIFQMCTFSMNDNTVPENQSLYQKHFGSFNQNKLLKGFDLCTSKALNNFICIASPPEGQKVYDSETIHATLMTGC
ncbi:hypothetical protein K7432_009655 [Basidiobolus ranarum]|uniref:Uncharacterized protein n=1 Tax=Basidiobolus ranarum TaxID=34480 RepID=A0ABR2WPX4_9FUNG